MNLIVLTPDREVFSGAIKSVKVPGTKGQFEVLKNHQAIVSSLQAGKIRVILENGEKEIFSIENGFIEVLNNEISLLVQGYQEV